jgi:cysteine synthase A
VCGADAERSVFLDHFLSRDPGLTLPQGSRIEGIGRPRVEASFLPGVLDAMVQPPDLWSLAATHALSARLGRRVGASTGTNLLAALACAQWLRDRGQSGSVVTLICDDGERYRQTCFDPAWLQAQGLDCAAQAAAVTALLDTGHWPAALRADWRLAGVLAGTLASASPP